MTEYRGVKVSMEDTDLLKYVLNSAGRVELAAGTGPRWLHKAIGARMGLDSRIKHLNGDLRDCRRCNLISESRQEGMQRIPIPKHNTSGVKGVSFNCIQQMWFAYIKVDGRNIHLGRFSSFTDAVAARQAAEDKYFCEPL